MEERDKQQEQCTKPEMSDALTCGIVTGRDILQIGAQGAGAVPVSANETRRAAMKKRARNDKGFMMEAQAMNHGFKRSLRWLLIFLTQLALISCAIGQTMYYFHSFNFDTGVDTKVYGHPEIDVLDYAYGSSRQFKHDLRKRIWN